MSFYHKIVMGQIAATDVATTQIPLNTDLGGETPKAIILTIINQGTTGVTTGPLKISHGMATSTALRRSTAAYYDFTGGLGDAGRISSTSAIAIEVSGTAVTGSLDLHDLVSDGATLIIDDQFDSDHIFIAEIFAGTEITDATIIDISSGLGTGAQSITTPGFPVVFAQNIIGAGETHSGSQTIFSIGRATPATGANHAAGFSQRNGVTPSNCVSSSNDVECIINILSSTDQVTYRAQITGQLSNGFTLNVVEDVAPSSSPVAYVLCLGGTFQVAIGTAATGTTSASDTFTPGFQAIGASFLSHNAIEQAQNAIRQGCQFSYGVWEEDGSTGFQNAVGFHAPDAVTTQPSVAAQVDIDDGNECVYLNVTSAGAIQGREIIDSASATDVTFHASDPDPSSALLLWAAFGEAPFVPSRFVVDVVTFDIPTSAATTPVVIALPNHLEHGISPKVIRAQIVGIQGPLDDGAGNVQFCYGMAVSTSSRRCAGGYSQTAVAPSNVNSFWRNDSLIATSPGSVVGGLLDVSDMSTPGEVTLIIDDAFPAVVTVQLVAWGGDDISGATIVDLAPTVAGAFNVTTVGHATRYLEILYPAVTTINAIENFAHFFSIGRCFVPDLTNQIVAFRSDDNETPTDSYSYANDVEIVANLSSAGAINLRGVCTGSLSNGFSLNFTEMFAGFDTFKFMSALAVNGTFLGNMGVFDAPTDGTVLELDPGFTKISGEFWSHNLAESTTDTSQAGARISLGLTLAPEGSTQASMGFQDPDAQNPSDPAAWISSDGSGGIAYARLDATGIFEAVGGIVAGSPVSPTGVLWQMAAPETGTARIMFAMFGEGEALPEMPMALRSSAKGYFFKALRGKR